VAIPDRENFFEDMFIPFDRIHECDGQTDGKTDGQTPHDGIGRAYAQHRATKSSQACYAQRQTLTGELISPAPRLPLF